MLSGHWGDRWHWRRKGSTVILMCTAVLEKGRGMAKIRKKHGSEVALIARVLI